MKVRKLPLMFTKAKNKNFEFLGTFFENVSLASVVLRAPWEAFGGLWALEELCRRCFGLDVGKQAC